MKGVWRVIMEARKGRFGKKGFEDGLRIRNVPWGKRKWDYPDS
jgi:hypothetical protein